MAIADLLSLPGYFLCTRGNCKMHVADCLKRQALLRRDRVQYTPLFGFCKNCPQGAENRIKEGIAMTDDIRGDIKDAIARETGAGAMTGNHFVDADKMAAGAGDGSRFGNHDRPVDVKQNPKGSDPSPEPWGRCKDCGGRAISKTGTICARCMALRGVRKRKAEALAKKRMEIAGGSTGQKPTGEQPADGSSAGPKPTGAKPGARTPENGAGDLRIGDSGAGDLRIGDSGRDVLSIRFDDYPEVLAGVKRLAGVEVRPVPHQVIYMLKSYIDASG